MKKVLSQVKRHIQSIPGKRLSNKYIIIESDDWGSERIPSKDSIEYLESIGIDVYRNPFNYLDSLETSDDLTALFETLSKFKDRKGMHPVITANSVVANPDFQKIKQSGLKEYYFENTLSTYKNKKASEKSYNLIKEGMEKKLYHPQFHGREHLNVKQWMSGLQSGNKTLLAAFEKGIYGIDLDIDITNRSNFMAAFDSNSKAETAGQETIIEEGINLFESTFGYRSKSFIAPCYVWHKEHEKILAKNGIKSFQGLSLQLSPVYDGKYKRKYHFQGERNKNNQIYFVRNCFFEPSLNRKFNWVQDCINRMNIIFSWGKPVIIGSHRINFIGSLNEENRRSNLQDLSILLQQILKTWPDVEFITTDKLVEKYS